VSAEVISSDFNTGLDLFADVILHPAFPAAPLERERQIQLANIRAQKDELLATAFRLMRRGAFGETGFGLHSLGTETSVQALRSAALKDFHASLAVPENCVLAIFGDVKASAVKAAIGKKFGAWKRRPSPLAKLPAAPWIPKRLRIVETRDKKQAVMVIGFPGLALDHPDRFALELIQESCSDLGSRLFLRIREKLGLAYYVGAQNFLGLAPGYFAFYVGTDPGQTDLVETELLREAEDLRNHGLTEDELRRAKAKIVGQKKIARQDLGGYAITAALDELYGLGYQIIDTEDALYEAVTVEQTRDVARKYLKADSLVVVVVQPGKAG
jgi:zinc protease